MYSTRISRSPTRMDAHEAREAHEGEGSNGQDVSNSSRPRPSNGIPEPSFSENPASNTVPGNPERAQTLPGPYQRHVLLSLDGGGIRGRWTLLVLRQLMLFCAELEETHQSPAKSSFDPLPYHMSVSQLPPTELITQSGDEDDSDDGGNPRLRLESLPADRRFLPCHYFDLIIGASTGSLISIMLGRFRMTVADCLKEYDDLGTQIFGKPRAWCQLNVGILSNRNKFSTSVMEKVCQEFCQRRKNIDDSNEHPHFRIGVGICQSAVVTFIESEPKILRSQHIITTYRKGTVNRRVRTGSLSIGPASRHNTGLSESGGQQKRKVTRDLHLLAWQAARGATAAEWYFKPLLIKQGTQELELSDDGMGRNNNPTEVGTMELENFGTGGHETMTVVSVGTARGDPEKKKRTALKNRVRRAFHRMADPAPVEEAMGEVRRFNHYFRFTAKGEHALKIELDHWEPPASLRTKLRGKQPGEDTRKLIGQCFEKWYSHNPRVADDLRECARVLVERRRDRTAYPQFWRRFATASSYQCRYTNCGSGKYVYQHDLERHLRDGHGLENWQSTTPEDFERFRWRYPPGQVAATS